MGIVNKEEHAMTATIDIQKVQEAHALALHEARHAAARFAHQYFGGADGGPCGFAWVNVYKVRKNSKMGKALAEVGFRKSYDGGLQQWNKWWQGQSVDAAEHGAVAYARVMKEQLGLDFCSGSRLD
jgi:hypothetical protein